MNFCVPFTFIKERILQRVPETKFLKRGNFNTKNISFDLSIFILLSRDIKKFTNSWILVLLHGNWTSVQIRDYLKLYLCTQKVNKTGL